MGLGGLTGGTEATSLHRHCGRDCLQEVELKVHARQACCSDGWGKGHIAFVDKEEC